MNRLENYKNLMRFGLSLISWALMTVLWSWNWWQEYRTAIYAFGYLGSFAYMALYGILIFFFTSFYGGYGIGYYRRQDLVFSSILALIIANGVSYLITSLVARGLIAALPMVRVTVIQAVVIAVWSYAANNLYIRIFPPRKMLMIYGGSDLAKSLIQKMLMRSEKYTIQEVISEEQGFEAICEKMKGYVAVVLCDLRPKMRNRLLKHCFRKSIRTYTTPKISDVLLRGATNITLFDSPLLLNRNVGLSLEQRILKRAMDLILSGIGLLVASPLMLIIAVLIKAYDGGPVIYRQERCTINGEVFTLIKFRSMIVDAEKDGKSRPAAENDPRITPVGKLIRMTRADELPQLWNVFAGQMSMVGPRPERLEHIKQYRHSIPEFDFRTKVKAGLTGYAQVIGRYNTSAYDKLKMDLMYISNYSLIEDIKLLFMTVKIIFMKSSTQGFQENELFEVFQEQGINHVGEDGFR